MNNRQPVVAMAAVLATALSLAQINNAHAQNPPPDLSGDWTGFVSMETQRSASDNQQPNFLSTMNYQFQLVNNVGSGPIVTSYHYNIFGHYNITNSDGSVIDFSGTAVAQPTDGTGGSEIVGNDLTVTLRGSSTDGSRINAHGTIRVIDGTPIIAVRYDRLSREQTGTMMHELGHNLGLLHYPATNPAPDVTATWVGPCTNNTPNHISSMNYACQNVGINPPASGGTPTTALTGTARLLNDDGSVAASFDLQGTVGLPTVQQDGSTASPFAAIGLNPGPVNTGQIAILTGLLHPGQQDLTGGMSPPIITGSYTLYNSMSDVFAEFDMNQSTATDSGTFSVSPLTDPGV
jgi:hypothetical protein